MDNQALKFWKIFAIALVVINLSLLAFFIFRPPHPPHQGEEEGGPAKFIIEKLHFTDAQITAFDQLKINHRDSVDLLRMQGRRLRETFFEGLKKDTFFNEILAQQIAANQKEIELLTYRHFAAVKKLCTPEQKIIFNQIIGEILQRMAPTHPPKPGHQQHRP